MALAKKTAKKTTKKPIAKKKTAKKKASARSAAPALYNKILVPVDLQHKSSWHKSLPIALAHARNFGAEVTVMTVVPDITSGIDWRYAIRGSMGGSEDYDRKQYLDEAKHNLAKLLKDQVPDGLRVKQLVRHGTIYKEVLNTAKKLGVDWIIMASHRPSLKDYLLGPNAARVVRHADCSVSVVRD